MQRKSYAIKNRLTKKGNCAVKRKNPKPSKVVSPYKKT